MSEDPYSEIAERYDLFFAESEPARAAFFEKVFQSHRVRRVLDCACGTGHDLIMFGGMGLEVSGSDVSDSMLRRARANLDEAGMAIPLTKVDYRELPANFPEPFDAVVCLSSSILHMPDEEQVAAAVSSMRSVLRDGGILAMTQETTDKQWREKPRFILAGATEAVSRLFVIDYDNGGARYNILDVYHGDPPQLRVWSVEYPRVFLADDYWRLLSEAGFRDVSLYGGYGFEPYDKRMSDRLILVAEN